MPNNLLSCSSAHAKSPTLLLLCQSFFLNYFVVNLAIVICKIWLVEVLDNLPALVDLAEHGCSND